MNPEACAMCVRKGTKACAACVDGSRLKLPKVPKKLEVKSKRKGAELERAARNLYERAARLRKNSGAVWYSPGDVSAPGLLDEAKDTAHITSRGRSSFTVHRDEFLKLEKEARREGRVPALVFRFKGDDRLFAVVDYGELCSLLGGGPPI